MAESNKCLITGNLKIMNAGELKPVDDAEIRIFKNGRLFSMTITDAKGNYRHELIKNSGEYEFEFVADDCALLRQSVIVDDTDKDIGSVVLK